MRGTGIRGLGAIAPRRGPFVRPLLRVGRDELHAWLETSGLEHRTDPSNADLDRDRNWLRTVILPQLAQRRSGVATTLARLADHARDDEMYLDELAAAARKRIVVDDLGVVVPVDVLRGPPAIASRVAREALSRAHVRIEAASVDALLELALRDRGHLPLTGDVGAWRLVAAVALLSDPVEPPAAVALPDEGTIALPEYGVVLRVSDGRAEPWTWRCGVPDAPGLSVRSRRPGDRVPTRRGTRKVQDVLVDAKVPRPLRSRTAVLVGADGPAGVVGVTGPRADLGTVVDARPLSRIWDHTGAWSDTTVRATS